MRHFTTFSLTFIVFSLLTASCSKRSSEANRIMDSAEALISSRPDSALTLINGIDTSAFADDEATSSRFAVVRTMIKDKCDYPLTDSLGLANALDFFTANDNDRYTMLANLYMGRYLFERKEYARSIIYYNRASIIAEELNDYFHLGFSNHCMAMVFRMIRDGQNELKHVKIAHQAYCHTDSTLHRNFSRVGIAEALMNAIQYKESLDSALLYYQIFKEQCDTPMIIKSLSTMATDYYRLGENQKSVDASETMLRLGAALDTTQLHVYGVALVNVGDLAQAKRVNEALLSIDSTYTWVARAIAVAEGDNNKAVKYLLENMCEITVKENEIFSQMVTSSLVDTKSQEILFNKQRAKSARRTTAVIAFLAALIILLTAMLIYQYRRRIRQQEAELTSQIEALELDLNSRSRDYDRMQTELTHTSDRLNSILSELGLKTDQIERVQEQLRQSNEELSSANQHLDRVLGDSYGLFNEICRAFIKYSKDNPRDERKYQQMRQQIEELQQQGEIYRDMERSADKFYNNILSSFRADYPERPEPDFQYFMFSVLGFSNSVIALFFSTDMRSIYNRRQRLKTAIKRKKSCPRAHLYLEMIK